MRTALIWMPPASISFPSPQIGYLKAFACEYGVYVDDYYLNLSFAELIGTTNYNYLLERDKSRLLEYLFSAELFENETTIQSYSNGNCRDSSVPEELFEINVAEWLDRAAERLVSREYELIGFSCTFSQVLPSLALAKRIKQKNPNIVVAFGGAELFPTFANEIIEKCPFIDHIILGHGENALLDIVNGALTTKIVARSRSDLHIDNLVTPDYDTYFNECKKRHAEKIPGFQSAGRIIPVMGGRGCWWAEKSRCSFCGGCGDTDQQYFQRNTAGIVNEMGVLAKRYESRFFNFIDAIEPNDFYSDTGLLKLLSGSDGNYVIFHQLRVPRNQSSFRMLDVANVRIIQPGLESLDSNILRLMKKGVAAKDVVRCLYWSKVYNIEVSWNILVGHPGEQIEWTHNIAEVIPKIYHLSPPARLVYVQFQRKSPIYETIVKTQHETSPISLIPDPRLSYLYPQDWNYQNIAAEFENPYEMSAELKRAHEELDILVSRWRDLWESPARPQLYVDRADNEWRVYDTRSDERREYSLKGQELEVAKQIVCDRDREAAPDSYLRYQTEIRSLIDNAIVTVIDGSLMWLPTLSGETKEAN